MQVLINNNARFCSQSKEKIKMENLIDDLEKSSSDKYDSDSNDGMESDDESNE